MATAVAPRAQRLNGYDAYLLTWTSSLGYALAYVWAYFHFLNFFFEYAGYVVQPRSSVFIGCSILLAVLPVAFCGRVRGVSSVIAIYVYSMLYVPIVITFAFASTRPLAEIVGIQLLFMIGMLVLFLADIPALENPWGLRLRVNLLPAALALTAVSTVYIAFAYRNYLTFASFGDEVYTHRSEVSDVGASLFMRYFSSWLTNVLIPLCLAYGLVTPKRRYFVIGSASCLVLYLAAAAKIIILFPIVYLGFYLAFRGRRLRMIFPLMVGGLAAAMGILAVAARWGPKLFLLASLIIYRTIGNAGQLTVQYDDFFTTHPTTAWSHIHVVDYVTHRYPYGSNQLGQAVGQFYTSLEQDANANFLATDGIAAMGPLGVLIASIACGLVLIVLNAATRGYDPMFSVLCFTPFIVGLLGTSLFSAMWSGGGFFLIVFFLINRRDPALAPSPTLSRGSGE